MTAMRDQLRRIGNGLDTCPVDLLPTIAALCALLLFFFLSRVYSYDSFASGTFDAGSLSWRDQPNSAKPPLSENEPDKVKKALTPTTKSQFQLDEFSARTVWLCSNFLMLCAGLALLAQSCAVLSRQVTKKVWLWILIAIFPGFILWLLKTMTHVAGEDLHIIGIAESRAKAISGLGPSPLLDNVENLMVLSVTFIFSFAIGSLCTKRDLQTVTVSQIAERARDTVGLLNICATFLVLGVFHLWTQWNWPITFLTFPKDRAFMRLISNSIALNVGSLFTVMLGAIYFTAHARIRHIAHSLAHRALVQHRLPKTESDIRETLARNGFEYSSFFDIPTLAKVLSPLIAAGPVAQLVEWVYAY